MFPHFVDVHPPGGQMLHSFPVFLSLAANFGLPVGGQKSPTAALDPLAPTGTITKPKPTYTLGFHIIVSNLSATSPTFAAFVLKSYLVFSSYQDLITWSSLLIVGALVDVG